MLYICSGCVHVYVCACAQSLLFSWAWFFRTPWTAVWQALLSMEFSRQEYWWRTCHFLLQGKLPDPGIKPASPALAGEFFNTVPSGKPCTTVTKCYILVLPQFFKTLKFITGAIRSWSFACWEVFNYWFSLLTNNQGEKDKWWRAHS